MVFIIKSLSLASFPVAFDLVAFDVFVVRLSSLLLENHAVFRVMTVRETPSFLRTPIRWLPNWPASGLKHAARMNSRNQKSIGNDNSPQIPTFKRTAHKKMRRRQINDKDDL